MQQCHVAMLRAQALKTRVHSAAMLKPNPAPPSLPPLRIPADSPRSSPEPRQSSSSGIPRLLVAAGSSRCRSAGDDEELDSPARHVLGTLNPWRRAAHRSSENWQHSRVCLGLSSGLGLVCDLFVWLCCAGEIANSGEVSSPLAKRSCEKSQAGRSRRDQAAMRSGGPLSARLNKNSFVSPRPRAAWL